MRLQIRRLLLFAVGLTLGAAHGCADDGNADDDDDVAADPDGDGEPSPFPVPGKKHPGWKEPSCFRGCHGDDPPLHTEGFAPHQCVECHGVNGAAAGHKGGEPCGICHSAEGSVPVEVDHSPARQFPDPESCTICHGE